MRGDMNFSRPHPAFPCNISERIPPPCSFPSRFFFRAASYHTHSISLFIFHPVGFLPPKFSLPRLSTMFFYRNRFRFFFISLNAPALDFFSLRESRAASLTPPQKKRNFPNGLFPFSPTIIFSFAHSSPSFLFLLCCFLKYVGTTSFYLRPTC